MPIDHSVSSNPAMVGGPLFAFLVITVVLVLATAVWVVLLRRRIEGLASQIFSHQLANSKLSAEIQALALRSREISQNLEELRTRSADREKAVPPGPALWVTGGTPMNLNRRGQILRLSRKGKSISEIASDLSISQGEVELMLKVQDLNQKNPAWEKQYGSS